MLSSREIYNKNAKGFSSKGVLNKQQNSSDARKTLTDAYTYNFLRLSHLFKRGIVDFTSVSNI